MLPPSLSSFSHLPWSDEALSRQADKPRSLGLCLQVRGAAKALSWALEALVLAGRVTLGKSLPLSELNGTSDLQGSGSSERSLLRTMLGPAQALSEAHATL